MDGQTVKRTEIILNVLFHSSFYLLFFCLFVFVLHSNLNGSNTYGTRKVSSRQGSSSQ